MKSFIRASKPIIDILVCHMKRILLATAISVLPSFPLHAVDVTVDGNTVSISNESFQLAFDLKNGTWSGTDLATETKVFANARFTVDEIGWKKPAGVSRSWKEAGVRDGFGKGRTLTITETPSGGYAPVKSLHLTV